LGVRAVRPSPPCRLSGPCGSGSEEFVAGKVAGKRSCYGTTTVDTPADERGEGCLVFKKGDIVAVGDIAQFEDAANGGWCAAWLVLYS
jgi:hypothetical protein